MPGVSGFAARASVGQHRQAAVVIAKSVRFDFVNMAVVSFLRCGLRYHENVEFGCRISIAGR